MICKDCGMVCKPFVPASRPEEAEWYCHKCHKSCKMQIEDIQRYMAGRHQEKVLR